MNEVKSTETETQRRTEQMLDCAAGIGFRDGRGRDLPSHAVGSCWHLANDQWRAFDVENEAMNAEQRGVPDNACTPAFAVLSLQAIFCLWVLARAIWTHEPGIAGTFFVLAAANGYAAYRIGSAR